MDTHASALEAPARGGDRRVLGIALSLFGLVVFTAMDTVSKLITAELHPIMIAGLRCWTTMLVLAPFALRAGPQVWKSSAPAIQTLRGAGMLATGIFFTLSLTGLPIADATAIFFASPLITTALSIPILGEKVGPRRWAAVFVGFAGVLVIVRPGSEGFNPYAVYPLLAAVTWAGALVVTRRMREGDDALTTTLWTNLAGGILALPLLPFVWTGISAWAALMLMLLGVICALGHFVVVRAYSLAPASLLAPFGYFQMLWSALAGWIVFATVPDAPTWTGAAIIAASGLYMLWRERVQGRGTS